MTRTQVRQASELLKTIEGLENLKDALTKDRISTSITITTVFTKTEGYRHTLKNEIDTPYTIDKNINAEATKAMVQEIDRVLFFKKEELQKFNP